MFYSSLFSRNYTKYKILATFLMLTVCWLWVTPTWAQSPTEAYKLKAVYLYNFLKFIDYPANVFSQSTSHLHICILGKDPFLSLLPQILKGKKAKDHPIATTQLNHVNQGQHCHLLFISQSETDRLSRILDYLANSPVFTVSDIKGFVFQGGMLEFYGTNDRIQFFINYNNVLKADLKIGSRLLRLASLVD